MSSNYWNCPRYGDEMTSQRDWYTYKIIPIPSWIFRSFLLDRTKSLFVKEHRCQIKRHNVMKMNNQPVSWLSWSSIPIEIICSLFIDYMMIKGVESVIEELTSTLQKFSKCTFEIWNELFRLNHRITNPKMNREQNYWVTLY